MPSPQAINDYRALMGDALDPDTFLRATGEAVARYDAAWKNAYNDHRDINAAMADFLLIATAHLDAMEMASLRRPAMATMISLLISVDMSKASADSLGLLLLDIHRRFIISCAELCLTTAGDPYAAPHAEAIMALEAPLYVAAYERYAATKPAWSETEAAAYAALALAARKKADAAPDASDGSNRIIPNPDAPAEALIDIFSRLHALGAGD